MATISIIVGGVETQLASLGALVEHTGWGMPDVNYHTTRAPGQHGDTWGGYALAPRFASLVFKLKQSELPAMYTLRSQLISLFSPLYPKIIVKFVTLEGTRYFDCHYPGGMVMDWSVQDWAAQGVAVPLMCDDSVCYDPTGLSWTFALGGGSDTFVVPYAVPYKMGASTINQSQVITYPSSIKPDLVRSFPPGLAASWCWSTPAAVRMRSSYRLVIFPSVERRGISWADPRRWCRARSWETCQPAVHPLRARSPRP